MFLNSAYDDGKRPNRLVFDRLVGTNEKVVLVILLFATKRENERDMYLVIGISINRFFVVQNDHQMKDIKDWRRPSLE